MYSNSSRTAFLLVFIAAVVIRFYFNFRIELIPGLGGGYYPVQVRSVLQDGLPAFSDMPLVFYICAAIVKLLSLIFPGQNEQGLIILVIKIVDSVSLPLILIPIYKIGQLFSKHYSTIFLTAVAGFAVLSFSPLDLASDGIKNSIALVFMAFVMLYYLRFLKFKKRSDLLLIILFSVLTILTHFGTFAITLFFILTGLVVFYGRKALLPMVGVLITGAIFVAVFDSDRAIHLFTFWKSAFSIFISQRLIYYPHGIFNYLSSFLLIWFMIRILRKKSATLTGFERNILILFVIFILALSFPFLKFEYGRRLGLMLFVPQSVVLLILYSYMKSRWKMVLGSSVIILVLFTISMKVMNPRPLSISDESYADLLELRSEFNRPGQTIVFVRHGLEWWVAWEFNVHIAGASVEVDNEMTDRYDHIYYLIQKGGENLIYPGKTSIFTQPTPPEEAVVVSETAYFKLYK